MATPTTAPAVDLDEVARALADQLEERSRDLARAQNQVTLDSFKVIELARRTVRGPITEDMVREYYEEHRELSVAPWRDLPDERRVKLVAFANHFGGLMSQ